MHQTFCKTLHILNLLLPLRKLRFRVVKYTAHCTPKACYFHHLIMTPKVRKSPWETAKGYELLVVMRMITMERIMM